MQVGGEVLFLDHGVIHHMAGNPRFVTDVLAPHRRLHAVGAYQCNALVRAALDVENGDAGLALLNAPHHGGGRDLDAAGGQRAFEEGAMRIGALSRPCPERRKRQSNLNLAVGFTSDLEAGFYQQALIAQDFVCLASKQHPRVQATLDRTAFSAEGHIVVSTSGTGHCIVDKVLARHKLARRVALRVPSFLGVARIVAQAELLVIVPRLLGNALASQEQVQLLEPPVPLPKYKVKQHWHERFNADAGNMWLRKVMAQLFSRLAV